MGFASFGQSEVAAGFRTEEKLYLAVWNTSDEKKTICIPIEEGKGEEIVKVGFPCSIDTEYVWRDHCLEITLGAHNSRFFEIS